MKKNNYSIILTILGEHWGADGSSVEDALANVKIEWQDIKGKGTMLVSDGTNSHEHLFNGATLRRIFNNKIARTIWSKNLELYLKEGKKSNIPKPL